MTRPMVECPSCEGWGQRFTSPHMTDPSAKDRWDDCSKCDGRGEIPDPEAPDEEEE